MRHLARRFVAVSGRYSTAPRILRPAVAVAARRAFAAAAEDGDFWGEPSQPDVGSAKLDWPSLGFDYLPTHGHWQQVWKDGQWESGRFVRDPYMTVHILSNVFHYGQALFEGLKVFHTKDGDVSVFFDMANFERMNHGCRRFRMPLVLKDMWEESIDEVVRRNVAYVPPYGSGGALYVRPFIFGSGPRLGLGPSPEYTFVVFCAPVGSYYKGGQMQALDALVNDEYDRAAPLGCGDAKAAGNYAADLESMHKAKSMGFPISLYLDAKERRFVEEFNTSNFIAITRDGKYVTPHSPRSVLASNTNKVLRQIAADMGIKVEVRPVDFEKEVDTWAEVGAVGTAVVVTPIRSFTRGAKKWEFGSTFPMLQKLHDTVRAIQNGEHPDRHGWLRKVELSHHGNRQLASIYPGL